MNPSQGSIRFPIGLKGIHLCMNWKDSEQIFVDSFYILHWSESQCGFNDIILNPTDSFKWHPMIKEGPWEEIESNYVWIEKIVNIFFLWIHFNIYIYWNESQWGFNGIELNQTDLFKWDQWINENFIRLNANSLLF